MQSMFLIVIDAFLKWPEVVVMNSTKIKYVILIIQRTKPILTKQRGCFYVSAA